jgi:hypothetical protein
MLNRSIIKKDLDNFFYLLSNRLAFLELALILIRIPLTIFKSLLAFSITPLKKEGRKSKGKKFSGSPSSEYVRCYSISPFLFIPPLNRLIDVPKIDDKYFSPRAKLKMEVRRWKEKFPKL